MNKFDQTDWATFGGCESAPGKTPMIREVVADKADYVIVVDLSGLTLLRFEEETGNYTERNIELPYDVALTLANAMPENDLEFLNDLIYGG